MNRNIFKIKTSNYLNSIEEIKGNTQAEKKETIQRMVNALVAKYSTTYVDIDLLKKDIKEKVPDNFIPLVFCKVCNLLKDIDGIKESLLSDNIYVFENALKATWFFDGSNKSLVTPEYYKNELFKHLSIKNRLQVIKNLSFCLRMSDTKIGEDLFDYISSAYDRKQALYLLSVCNSSFIINKLEEEFFVIPISILETITKKDSEVFIVYFKLLKPVFRVFKAHIPILMKLLHKNVDDFLDFVNKDYYYYRYIKLSNKQLKAIIIRNIDDIIKNPKRYINIIPKNFFCMHMSIENFRLFFLNLVKESKSNFDVHNLLTYLKFKDKKLCFSILRSTYLEVYKKDLFCQELHTNVEMLQYLDSEERISVAKSIFDPKIDWLSKYEIKNDNRWFICCLSIEESILLIKEQIFKCSTPIDRYLCWNLLVKACVVNNDIDSLVSCLNFVNTRYKNDQPILLFNFLCRTLQFDIIEKNCCNELDILVKILYAKNTFYDDFSVVDKDLIKLHYLRNMSTLNIQMMFENLIELKLKIGYDISESMNMYCRILVEKSSFFQYFFPSGSIKICLTEAFCCFESEFKSNSKIKDSAKLNIIYNIIKYIEGYNNTVMNDEPNLLAIKDFPWLHNMCLKIYENDSYKELYRYEDFIQRIHKEFPEISNLHISLKKFNFDRDFTKSLRILKNNRQLIVDEINKLVEVLGNLKYLNRMVYYFLRCCKWYNDISKLLFNKLLDKLQEDDANYRYFISLAILCDDSDLIDIVTNISLIDENNLNEEEKRNSLKLHAYTLKALINCDYLLPIKCIERILLTENFINLVKYLQSIALRYSLEETKQLAIIMIDNKISIKKHGLILFYSVGSIEEILDLNKKMIETQTNFSIRKYVFDSLLNLLITNDNDNIWTVLKEIMYSLKYEDEIWDDLVDVKKIPIKFLNEYILLFLEAIERVKNENMNKFNDTASRLTRNIFEYFSKNDIMISDALHSFIFETYFLQDRLLDWKIFRKYILKHYICSSDKFEKRLKSVITVLSNKDMKNYNDKHLIFVHNILHGLIFNDYLISKDKVNIITEHLLEMYYQKVPLGKYAKYTIMIELFKNNLRDNTPLKLSKLIKNGLPKLVNLYGRCSIPFIAENYGDLFFENLYIGKYNEKNQEAFCKLMSILLNDENSDIGLFVAIMIFKFKVSSQEWVRVAIKKLERYGDPTIGLYVNCYLISK